MSKRELLNSEVTIVQEHLLGADVIQVQENWRFSNASPICEPVFDFTNCKSIDSTAIGALVLFNSKCYLHGARVILRNLETNLYNMVKDTGLDRIFSIEKNGFIKDPDMDFFGIATGTKLHIEKEYSDKICFFVLSGLMDFPSGSAHFKQQILFTLAQYKKIVVDMEKLALIDSLCVGAILNMNDLFKRTGGSFCLCGANPLIVDMFSVLGIDKILQLFDNRQDALENWN